ncbi:MAG: aminotransferase class I/II-fold pyridoxal phosphate-dependent enzyme [Eubacteriales bacterium]
MKQYLNDTVINLPPSGIRAFFDIVSQMEGAISLGVGEPDFTTPWNIREAAIYSLEQGETHYTSNWGTLELREYISKYMKKRFDLRYNPQDQIVITVGASEGIDIALRSIVRIGDEVLVPEPSYVSYAPGVLLANGTPVPVVTGAKNKFKITPEELEAAITPKTRCIIFPYPNNPTGGIMTKEDLDKLVPIFEKHPEIIIISDEIYAELTYSNSRHVSLAQYESLHDRVIILSGFSKSYAMTGWRLGYACGHPEIIGAMVKIHQYTMLCAPIMSQKAAAEALRQGLKDNFDSVEKMKRAYNRRRRLIVKRFNDMGLDCFEPEGAFYVFPSIQSTGLNSMDFCQALLKSQKVAVVPGTAFGACGEGFIRCSYAYSVENINAALYRIEKFLEEIKK